MFAPYNDIPFVRLVRLIRGAMETTNIVREIRRLIIELALISGGFYLITSNIDKVVGEAVLFSFTGYYLHGATRDSLGSRKT